MTIREIEDATGLPRANVCYYESLGLIHLVRAANSYRGYRQQVQDMPAFFSAQFSGSPA